MELSGIERPHDDCQQVRKRALSTLNNRIPRAVLASFLAAMVVISLLLRRGTTWTWCISLAVAVVLCLLVFYWEKLRSERYPVPSTSFGTMKRWPLFWVLGVPLAISLLPENWWLLLAIPAGVVTFIIVYRAGIPSAKEPNLDDPSSTEPVDLIKVVLDAARATTRDSAFASYFVSEITQLPEREVLEVAQQDSEIKVRLRHEAMT